MIGNDVVDLKLTKTESNWQRKGFLEKQFTDSEISEILNSTNPFVKVWLFWSMKEAAYKCYVQEHQKRFFAPKKFSCKIISDKEGVVQIESKKYFINYLMSNNYIVSVARKTKKIKMVSELIFIDKKESSTKIIDDKLLSFFTNETQLLKNDLGIPSLYQNNKKLPISVSKTHHGDYGAFAFTFQK
ncbi:4'-phosphopantetheinyl transferase superfamily protein [Polaribacter sp. Hel_I_88]|uniref:4'-phosphopantetheinyl transferase family protein n=1 Tax=Polaribacter sp. Hel_I_88 TaxID=1250006 RepID=UPI00047A3C0B|nr:4'-phosphopantetheinyl transferase superfamily protein [Polaribacter sp. Hel_I_88]